MVQVAARELRVGDMIEHAGLIAEVTDTRQDQGKVIGELAGVLRLAEWDVDEKVEVFEFAKGAQALDILLGKSPDTPAMNAARRIMQLETELNRAIRQLPPNTYVKATVKEYDVGRTHPMPVVTLTVAQEE